MHAQREERGSNIANILASYETSFVGLLHSSLKLQLYEDIASFGECLTVGIEHFGINPPAMPLIFRPNILSYFAKNHDAIAAAQSNLYDKLTHPSFRVPLELLSLLPETDASGKVFLNYSAQLTYFRKGATQLGYDARTAQVYTYLEKAAELFSKRDDG